MVVLVKFIDRWLGSFVCGVLGLFSGKRQGKQDAGEPKGILVIQLWGIGETILTLPAIDALRRRFPKSKIEVLATSRNRYVYSGNRNIDKVIVMGLNPFSVAGFMLGNIRKYDLVMDMEEYLNISAIISFFCGSARAGYSHGARAKLYTSAVKYNDRQHAIQTFLDIAGLLGGQYDAKTLPRLSFSRSDKNFVGRLLKISGIKGRDFIVCVAPGAAESAKSRMWPYERYAELCDELIERHNAKIIFIGSLDEYELVGSVQKAMESKNSVNSAGKLSLPQLFCLISKSNLFIGNDAGPMHIAAAQGVKTIGLFGPNIPLRFGPYGKGNIAVYKGYNCQFSPCINVHKGEVPDCLYPRDSNDYQKCMKNISVDDVLKEVESVV